MAMHLVTGYAGEEHITAADQGSFNAAFFGTGQYVMEAGNMCEASITSNNNVRILDGDILMKGRHIRIKPNTYEDVAISTGTAGVNRNDLIVVEYNEDTTTGIETISLNVIRGTETSGTPTDPAYTDGDVLGDASFNQMPLYRVRVEGVVLASIEPMFETIYNFQTLANMYKEEFVEACEEYINSLGVLDTMEEVEGNTQENQLAGALAVKELSGTVHEIYKKVEGVSCNIRYVNDETNENYGKVQYKDNNGNWVTLETVVSSAYYLYKDGINNGEFDVTNKYTIASVQNFFDGTFTVNDDSMTMQVANSNGAGSYNVISRKIDITSFSKLVFSHDTTISSAGEYHIVALWIADELVEGGRTFPVLRNNYLISGTAANGTVECDVSHLEGEVYIGFFIQLNASNLSAKTTITEMYLE